MEQGRIESGMAMWVRKRIDIGWSDLARGAVACLRKHDDSRSLRTIGRCWSGGGRAPFVALSVRSGLDLLLSTEGFEPGDEIAMSALTIPDMPRIVREHGLVPVPIDVDPLTLSISEEAMLAALSPRTKGVVVAHLFGGRMPLGSIAEICRARGLLLIEDCAQAFAGFPEPGTDEGDISMYSFGPIKTHSSLIGAVFTCRDPDLADRLNAAQEAWPQVSGTEYLQRLIKYGFVKGLSLGPVAGTVAASLRLVGRDHDRMATQMARGFAGGDFFSKIRRRPASAILAMMSRRFAQFHDASVQRRRALGERFRARIGERIPVLGSEALDPTYWVLAISVDNPTELVPKLWRHGFDATCSSSLQAIPAPADRPHLDPVSGRQTLATTVFLPLSHRMSDRTVDRLADLVRHHAIPRSPSLPPRRGSLASNRAAEPLTLLSRTSG